MVVDGCSGVKISVCVPVYDVKPHYLASLLASVAAQNYSDYEVIIGDDCSQVDYTDTLAQFSEPAKLQYARNAVNIGMVANWNRTVARATGDVGIVLGHDDVIAPGMFATYVGAFMESDATVLVSSGSGFIDEEGLACEFRTNVNHRSNIFIDCPRYDLNGREVSRLCLRNGSAIGELSVQMFRLSAFRATGGYDPQFRHAADADLAIRVADRGTTVYLNSPFLLRRMHSDNLTWRHLAEGNITADRARLFEKHHGRHSFTTKEIAQFKAYLVACACYDVMRLPRHRSVRTMAKAFAQMPRYATAWVPAYIAALAEIVSRRNLDAR